MHSKPSVLANPVHDLGLPHSAAEPSRAHLFMKLTECGPKGQASLKYDLQVICDPVTVSVPMSEMHLEAHPLSCVSQLLSATNCCC